MTMENRDDGDREPGELENAVMEGEVENALVEANFPGGRASIESLRRGDPIVTAGQRQQSSVLQTYIRPVYDDKQYRAVLMLANWEYKGQDEEWLAAFTEQARYGVDVRGLVDFLHAKIPGITGGRSLRDWEGETISHTTFNLNSNQAQQRRRSISGRNGRSGPITE